MYKRMFGCSSRIHLAGRMARSDRNGNTAHATGVEVPAQVST